MYQYKHLTYSVWIKIIKLLIFIIYAEYVNVLQFKCQFISEVPSYHQPYAVLQYLDCVVSAFQRFSYDTVSLMPPHVHFATLFHIIKTHLPSFSYSDKKKKSPPFLLTPAFKSFLLFFLQWSYTLTYSNTVDLSTNLASQNLELNCFPC